MGGGVSTEKGIYKKEPNGNGSFRMKKHNTWNKKFTG